MKKFSKTKDKNQSASKGLTPNKQKRRPGGGQPSPVKKFSYQKKG